MHAWIARWWELRRSPHRWMRVVWWSLPPALILAAVFPLAAAIVFLVVWIIFNSLLGLAAAVWGIFHPRAVLRGARAVLGWGLVLAALLTLWMLTMAQTALPEQIGAELAPAIAFVLGLVVFVFCCLLLFPVALEGAAIGGYVTRRLADADAAPVRGARAFLFSQAVTMLALSALPNPEDPLQGIVFFLPFTFTMTVVLVAHRAGTDTFSLAQSIGRGLSRSLVWQFNSSGVRRRRLDFRGVALGLVAGGVVALLANTRLLAPLQNEVLVAQMRLRNQPFVGMTMLPALGRPDPGATKAAEKIVLLDLDPDTRRQVAATSEARVQAQIIRRMKKWGAARVVLPLPTLAAWWTPVPTARADAPRALPATIARTIRDLPVLESALRESRNVVLAVPRLRIPTPFRFQEKPASLSPTDAKLIQRLMTAAGSAGMADLDAISARLPVIATTWKPYDDPMDRFHLVAAPLLVAASESTSKASAPSGGAAWETARIAGREVSLVTRDRVLVDFRTQEPGRAFATVSYSSILSGAPLFPPRPEELNPTTQRERLLEGMDRDEESASRQPSSFTEPPLPPRVPSPPKEPELPKSVPPAQFFQGKIVFLDAVQGSSRPTPIGTMSRAELLGAATVTLLADRQIRRFPGWLWSAGLLLLGAVVGAICARRAPLSVGLTAAVVLVCIQLGSFAAFLGGSLWLDPVAPNLTVLASALLVGQLTFLLERKEREDNRQLLQRFVAPQVVEELLENVDELGLGGQRQRLCVLFADARNFSAYSEQNAPEEVVETINAYTTAMTQALFAHKGILDKYTGDGLMAFFRITDSSGADVAHAVQGALAMRAAAEAVSEQRRVQGRPALPIGIGMHYGEAIVGLVGNPDRWDYTALGVTVVISQRLQGIAAGGEVVVSEALFDMAAGGVIAEARDPVQVKGLAALVTPYRVLSLATPAAILAPGGE
jgi:class 3 adenylate cyclase